MSTREHTSEYRPGINAVLHEHEQMSAWLFFAVMSYLVMHFTPEFGCTTATSGGILWYTEIWLGTLLGWGHAAGVLILHSVVIGIWLLYCLKTASLFVRRSTAWAITGLMFIYCTDLWAGPSELNLTLQTISMYHLLVWARGKKDVFPPRHLFLTGMGVTVAMMTTPTAVFFWLPVIGHMLWVNHGQRLQSSACCAGGLVTPWAVVMLISIFNQSSADLIQPTFTPYLCDWQNSLLFTKPLAIFVGTLPGCCQSWVPPMAALIPGHLLLFMWLRPFRKIRRSRKLGINTTLGIAFVLVFVVSFCMMKQPHFTAFYPFMFISGIGLILSIRRRIRNRSAKRVLRGIGLMVPLITLFVLLIIPVLQTAMGKQSEQTSPRTSAIEHIINSWQW